MLRGLIAATALALLLGGCVTPMSNQEVEEVTTCKNTDLKKIRKNLLMAGYEIKSMSDEDLQTGYKQTSGYGTDRGYARITVIKMDEKNYRFRVRRLRKSVQNVGNSYSNNDRRRRDRGTTININQAVETENESDQPYYKEHKDRYLKMQREVCG